MDGGQVPGHWAGVVQNVLEVADPGADDKSKTGSAEVDVDDRAGGRGQVAGGQGQRQEDACH